MDWLADESLQAAGLISTGLDGWTPDWDWPQPLRWTDDKLNMVWSYLPICP